MPKVPARHDVNALQSSTARQGSGVSHVQHAP